MSPRRRTFCHHSLSFRQIALQAALLLPILLLPCTPSSILAQQAPKEGESYFFVPPGFRHEGIPKTVEGAGTGQLRIVVHDVSTGKPTPCRINVVGADGNFYQPPENPLTPWSLTGQWPAPGAKGNRIEKAPWRYLGRFFYCSGDITVSVPAGVTRVEVFKGFEYRPQTSSVVVSADRTHEVSIAMERTAPMAPEGYHGGDPHLHFARVTEQDDTAILDLLDAEDIWYGTPLGYNEPAGPYFGFMDRMDSPQFRGLGVDSVLARGKIRILSGQEYRSQQYGHLNLFLRDRLVFAGESHNADEWPVYGHVGSETRSQGGIAIHAHGGYALEIYADAALGTVDGVELLQFGVYRGIGLGDWYHILNCGYRFPCVGASDYPACRFLGDCRTYVRLEESSPTSNAETQTHDGEGTANVAAADFSRWLRGAADGHSFVTTGPLLLLDVGGARPGETIRHNRPEPATLRVRARVRCEVTPVRQLDLIANGEVLHSVELKNLTPENGWYVVEKDITLTESRWIAARAWSVTPGGQPDAESHTNPVYFYAQNRRPWRRDSVDAWVNRIDGQIERHAKRTFAKKAGVLDYFQRARDLLMTIRQRGGLAADEDPAVLAEASADASLAEDLALPDASEDQLREFLKPVPQKSPQEALDTFEGVQGFQMQLVAAEPLVTSPIAAAFDEDGQLYVCEMRDYPYKPAEGRKPIGRVTLLRDTNGDGTFDESHVFADELLWAAGVVPWKGGVFVASTPDIWYLKDTDGDFRADVKRRVFTGFGMENQQAMVNNLQFGPDHMIYGSTAGNGGLIRRGDDPTAPAISVSGRDFRFDPVTERFELVTGTVQFGNTFDDWGNRFVCSESQPLLQIVLPDHYLARNPFLAAPSGIRNIAPGPVPIFRISPIERWRQIRSSRRISKNERTATAAGASHHVVDAAAGVVVYRGGAYPPEFYGQVFVGDGQNNLIHRRRLVPDGVTWSSERADEQTDFIRSSDIWFRPVNLINAPDGTLYCCDMSREFLESIHIPLDIVRHLDLRSGRDSGRIYRIAPPGFTSPPPPRLSQATTPELVTALESPHGWWRDTAQRLLFERQDPAAVPLLQRLVRESTRPESRLLAMAALDGLQALDDPTRMLGLRDSHPGVRENSLRLAEPRLNSSPELLATVAALSEDPSARVRFQTAFSLGESRDPLAAEALAGIAVRDGGDTWMRAAVLSSSAAIADQLFSRLIRTTPTTPAVSAMTTQLIGIVGARNRPEEVDRTLQTLAASPLADDPAVIARLLSELGNGVRRAGGILTAANGTPGAKLLQQALSTAADAAIDRTAVPEVRLAAVVLLSSAPSPEHRELLTDLLAVDQPEPVQTAAVRALAEDPDPRVSEILLEHWDAFLPEVRRVALAAMLSRPHSTRKLLEAAVREDVSVADVEPTRRDLLMQDRDETIRGLAQQLFGAAENSPRDAVVAEYQPALKLPADPSRGRPLFQKNCSGCHQLEGQGHAIGPLLASSPARDPAALLVHILDPNRYVLPSWLQYVVVDRSGRTYTGILAAQSATSITLKKEKGETVTLLRGEIEELVSSNKSLMPEGFEKQLPSQAMADLLAYLVTAATRSPDDPHAERDFGTLPGLIESDDP